MTATMPPAHPLRDALPLFLVAGLCLSSLDATAKVLVRDHALFLVVWARYIGQMIVVTPIAWHRAGHGFWRTKHLGMQLVRSLCLVFATAAFFGALRFLPLAEASAINFLAPIFAVVLSIPVLRRASDARALVVVDRRLPRHPHPDPARLGGVPSGDRAARARRDRERAVPALDAAAAERHAVHDAVLLGARRHRRAFDRAAVRRRAARAVGARRLVHRAAGTLRRARPLAADHRVHARAGIAARAVHIPADDLGDDLRLRALRHSFPMRCRRSECR